MSRQKARWFDWADTTGMDIPGTNLSSFVMNQDAVSEASSQIDFKRVSTNAYFKWDHSAVLFELNHSLKVNKTNGKFLLPDTGGYLEGAGDVTIRSSASDILFTDQFVSTPIPFSETGETALDASFTAVSILGAINEMRFEITNLQSAYFWMDPVQHSNQLIDGGSGTGGIAAGGEIKISDYTQVSAGDTITVNWGSSSFVLTASDTPTYSSGEFKSDAVATSNADMAQSIYTAILAYTNADNWDNNTAYNTGEDTVYLIYDTAGTAGNGTITLSGTGIIKGNPDDGTAFVDLRENTTLTTNYEDFYYTWNADLNEWKQTSGPGSLPAATDTILGLVTIGDGLTVLGGNVDVNFAGSGTALTVSHSDHTHSDLHARQHALNSGSDHTGQLDWSQASNLAGTSATSFAYGNHSHAGIAGTDSATFTINQDNVSADAEDSFLSFERGSTTPNAYIKWDSTNDRFYINFPLEIYNTDAQKLYFNDGTDTWNIDSGTVNPTVTAVNANTGSLYVNTDTGILYIKEDDGSSTNWRPLGGLLYRTYKLGSEADNSPTNTIYSLDTGQSFMTDGWNLLTYVNGFFKSVTSGDYTIIDTNTIQFTSSLSNSDNLEMLVYGAGGDFGHNQNTDTGTNSNIFRVGNSSAEGAILQALYFGEGLTTSDHGIASDTSGKLGYKDVGGSRILFSNLAAISDIGLDQAYDKGGAGAGRSITVDQGEIRLLGAVESKLEFFDGTDSFKVWAGTANPKSTAKNSDKGSIYVNTSTPKWYGKTTDGSDTSWSEFVMEGANTNITSMTGLTGDIRWSTDGAASIGTSTNYRPNNIYAKNILQTETSLKIGTNGTSVESKYGEYTLGNNQATFAAIGGICTVSGIRSIVAEYSINRGTTYEVGSLLVIHDGTDGYLSQQFLDTLDTGVDFDADYNSGSIRILYKTTNTGTDATLKIKVTYFKS